MALDNLKATSTELLGQVNITISDITQKTPNPDYKDYQSKVNDFKKLVGYQNTLVAVLEEISKLTYLLGKGSISIERNFMRRLINISNYPCKPDVSLDNGTISRLRYCVSI